MPTAVRDAAVMQKIADMHQLQEKLSGRRSTTKAPCMLSCYKLFLRPMHIRNLLQYSSVRFASTLVGLSNLRVHSSKHACNLLVVTCAMSVLTAKKSSAFWLVQAGSQTWTM